jgi:23S rRNA (uracil1939-C5)-methyltransferase
VDLYAGVGLFALSAAATGHDGVVAVEGDPISAADLDANAVALGERVRTCHVAVERFLAGRRGALAGAQVILDPPRTGISREAMAGLLEGTPARIVYVSCDVATFARDCRRLIDAGFTMAAVEAFDLFPNTAHVEVLTHFLR